MHSQVGFLPPVFRRKTLIQFQLPSQTFRRESVCKATLDGKGWDYRFNNHGYDLFLIMY